MRPAPRLQTPAGRIFQWSVDLVHSYSLRSFRLEQIKMVKHVADLMAKLGTRDAKTLRAAREKEKLDPTVRRRRRGVQLREIHRAKAPGDQGFYTFPKLAFHVRDGVSPRRPESNLELLRTELGHKCFERL